MIHDSFALLQPTILNLYPIGSFKRKDRKAKKTIEVRIPNIVENYNEYTGRGRVV